MNMQAMLNQAKKMQQDMMKAQAEIESKTYTATSAMVSVTLDGKKKVTAITIQKDENIEKEDIEMLEDMLVVAINDAMKQIDKVTEEKLGKFANIPGLM